MNLQIALQRIELLERQMSLVAPAYRAVSSPVPVFTVSSAAMSASSPVPMMSVAPAMKPRGDSPSFIAGDKPPPQSPRRLTSVAFHHPKKRWKENELETAAAMERV